METHERYRVLTLARAPSFPRALHAHQFVLAELVERFFRNLTQNRPRRGAFRDVEELIAAIGDYIDHHDQNG